MQIYLTKHGASKFIDKFNEDMIWDIKASMSTVDNREGLKSLQESLDDGSPPIWTTMFMPKFEDEDQQIELKHCDSVSDNIKHPGPQRIYRGTSFFTINYNLVTYDSRQKTLEAALVEALVNINLMAGCDSIRLICLRVFHLSDGDHRLTLGKKKHPTRIE